MKKLLQKYFASRRSQKGPAVQISYFAEKTASPKVCVSACSQHGMMTLVTLPKTIQHDAQATLSGQTLAHIMECRLDDRRPPANRPRA